MKNVMMFALGRSVIDSATGMFGNLTHMYVTASGAAQYQFQPAMLNTKSGATAKRFWIDPTRVREADEIQLPEVVRNSIPVLGTVVIDRCTKFTG